MGKTKTLGANEEEILRIAYICLNFPPAIGGIASQLSEVAKELANRGHEMHILTPGIEGAPAFEELGNLFIHRIPMAPGAISKSIYILKAIICFNKIRPDLVHAHDIFLPTTTSAIYKLFSKTPVVLTIHTSSSGLGLGDVAVLKQSRFGPFRQNWLSWNIDYFIVISRIIEKDIKTMDIPASKLVPIPNGIDMERFIPASPDERSTLRQQLGLPEGMIVIYTGRLHTDKRVDKLVKIWAGIREEHPDASLILVGAGPDEEALRRSAGPGVIFTGSTQNVAPYLRSADLFVLPSISEGFSLSVLEALACGLPVVATPVGAIPELIQHGQNGWIVEVDNLQDLGNSIRKLMDDPDLRTCLGHAGRQSVEKKYSLSTIASELIDLYRLAKGKRKS